MFAIALEIVGILFGVAAILVGIATLTALFGMPFQILGWFRENRNKKTPPRYHDENLIDDGRAGSEYY